MVHADGDRRGAANSAALAANGHDCERELLMDSVSIANPSWPPAILMDHQVRSPKPSQRRPPHSLHLPKPPSRHSSSSRWGDSRRRRARGDSAASLRGSADWFGHGTSRTRLPTPAALRTHAAPSSREPPSAHASRNVRADREAMCRAARGDPVVDEALDVVGNEASARTSWNRRGTRGRRQGAVIARSMDPAMLRRVTTRPDRN